MATSNRTDLSVRDLETFDPQSSTRNGRESRFLCPLCGDGKPRDAAHRSLCANLETGAWNCQRCKATGKLTDFWQERPKSNPREMARIRRAHFSKLPEPEARLTEESAQKAAWRDQLRDIRVLDNTPGEIYLRNRGIDVETAKSAGVMFAPNFYGKPAAIFPICNRGGQQTGASGRYFAANATPKTRIAGTKRNGAFVTAGALAAETIILTEAPIDALSLASLGFPALALCGTSAPAWLDLACGLRRVLLAFDADEAGDSAAATITTALSPFGAKCARLRPDGAKDWNEALQCDPDALRDLVTRAIHPTAWTREDAKTALDLLREEAAMCVSSLHPGTIKVTSHLLELWRAAEDESGQELTISGRLRQVSSTRSHI